MSLDFCRYFDILEIKKKTDKGILIQILDENDHDTEVWLSRKYTKILSVQDQNKNWKRIASIPEWLAIKIGLIAPICNNNANHMLKFGD